MQPKQPTISIIDEIIDRVIEAFPKLYYSVPLLAAHGVELKIKHKKSLRLTQPQEAILWICDLLLKESGKKHCTMKDLAGLVRYWYDPAMRPEAFKGPYTKHINDLKEHGYVATFADDDKEVDRGSLKKDNRRKWITLTDDGRAAVRQLQEIRKTHLKLLLNSVQDMDEAARSGFVTELERFASLAWAAMNCRENGNDQEPDSTPRDETQNPVYESKAASAR